MDPIRGPSVVGSSTLLESYREPCQIRFFLPLLTIFNSSRMRYNRDFLPWFTNKHSDSIIEQAESIAITIRYNHFVFPFRPFFSFFFFFRFNFIRTHRKSNQSLCKRVNRKVFDSNENLGRSIAREDNWVGCILL